MTKLRASLSRAVAFTALTYLLLSAHDALSALLTPATARLGAPAPVAAATLLASLAVQLLAGVWVLPRLGALPALRPHRTALRVVGYATTAAIAARAVCEALLEARFVDLPLLALAAPLAAFATWCVAADRRPRRVRADGDAASALPARRAA